VGMLILILYHLTVALHSFPQISTNEWVLVEEKEFLVDFVLMTHCHLDCQTSRVCQSDQHNFFASFSDFLFVVVFRNSGFRTLILGICASWRVVNIFRICKIQFILTIVSQCNIFVIGFEKERIPMRIIYNLKIHMHFKSMNIVLIDISTRPCKLICW
jgi:hypothetical protein